MTNARGSKKIIAPRVSMPAGDDLCLGLKNTNSGLRGRITAIAYDHVSVVIRGFAFDPARPDRHLSIEAVLDGSVIGQTLASATETTLSAEDCPAGHGFLLSSSCGGESFVARGRICVSNSAMVLPRDSASIVDLRNHPSSLDPRSAIMPKGRPSSPNVIGAIEGMAGSRFLSGWALDLAAPHRPVELGLYIDDRLYARTRTQLYRRDICNSFGGDGLAGFAFELNCDLLVGGQRSFRIAVLDGPAKLKGTDGLVRGRPRGLFDPVEFLAAGQRAVDRFVCLPPTRAGEQSAVAIIVLNYNGAALLDEFFESFVATNSHPRVSFIVIDHGSTDQSKQIAGRFAKQLDIEFIERGHNYSFSDSNNFAASRTSADVLLFVNNDVIWTDDVVPSVVQLLGAPHVGAVGIKLVGRASADAQPVEHIGVHFDPNSDGVLPAPFETRPAPHLAAPEAGCWHVPAATAAFLGCRAETFQALSGFDTAYHYGYEDVDFCLRLTLRHGLHVVCRNDVSAVHLGGASRYHDRLVSVSSQQRNHRLLLERWARPLRQAMRQSMFERPGFWTTQAPVIAFAVSEAKETTATGDYYTAKEFGAALTTKCGCRITYLEPAEWYNLAGVDVLIAMTSSYDLRRASRQNLGFTAIAWARNWIDDWAANPSIDAFQMLWAPSEIAADYLKDKLKRDVSVVRLATNFETFSNGREQPDWACDYAFAGNYHDDAREIEYALSQLPRRAGKVFGHNWQRAAKPPRNLVGPVAYGSMPDVYASAKVVIDDANSTTNLWGSVNSRVYDALAAGRLVITNGAQGAREVFGEELPIYRSPGELQDLLDKFLDDDEARGKLVAGLQAKVREQHTYAHRAEQFEELYRHHAARCLRIGIKIAAPSASVRHAWGDYHFARGIADAFGRRGHVARIDTMDQWYSPLSLGDDCTLVLRGLTEYNPRPGQINLVWVISHPESIAPDELRRYDNVFVASERYAEELTSKFGIEASVLLQCTDPAIFDPEGNDRGLPSYDVLFVGNSRGELRTSVRLALEVGCQLAIFGGGWEGLVPPGIVKGHYVANSALPALYRRAGVVLVDHWDDMRRNGFISNRIFDAAAVGARMLSDRVGGLRSLFGIKTFDDTAESFRKAINAAMKDPDQNHRQRIELSQRVRREHSFDVRVSRMLELVGFREISRVSLPH